jgi:anti-sigma factor RsiW
MDCEEIRERLSAYVDDDLDRASKAVVEEHLASCKACQQEVASLKALVRELGALESVEPPKDFLNQLNERIEARSWFPKILRTLFKPMRVKIPLEFAGVVAVAILVFVVLHTQKEELGLKQAPVGPARHGGRQRPLAGLRKRESMKRVSKPLARE